MERLDPECENIKLVSNFSGTPGSPGRREYSYRLSKSER